MLVDPPIEKLLPHVENRYTLAIAVARRTRQLVDGARPGVEAEDNPSLVTLASKELAENKVIIVPGDLEPVIPLRPEITLQLEQAMREEDDEDGSLPATFMSPVEEEEQPAPVSKIRIMDPNEVFYMPYEVDDDEALADGEGEDIEEEDEEEEVEIDRRFVASDDEDFDFDLDGIDGSIDDEPKDEDDDL